MVRSICITFGFLLLAPIALAAEDDRSLQEQFDQLSRQLQELGEKIHREQADKNLHEETALENSEAATETTSFVNLTPQQKPAIEDAGDSNTLSNPWWRNIDFSGFGAVGFYDTGSAGTRDKGGFEIKEASLFISADVWDDVEFFVEFQTNRLGRDGDQFTRTGEVYVHFHDIAISANTSIGMKFGRLDIPFGEEYLWQDAFDNPLITNSAGWPYATDEGIEFYGKFKDIGWILSATDGLLFRGREQNSDKAINLKIYGQLLEPLYLSFSVMSNGSTSVSAMQFAGSFLQPIGGFGHQSTLGVSPSSEIDANLAEIDLKYELSFLTYDAYLALSFGAADIDDNEPAFDRNFRWFFIEPSIRINQNWYAILRYSEIGTYENDEGYHFDGKTFAGGNSAFGYDTKRFQRLSLGLGWTPNPHVKAKLEIAKDWFELIEVSPLNPNNGDRGFVGFEIAVGF